MNEKEITETGADSQKAETRQSDPNTQSPQIYRPRKWPAVVATISVICLGIGGFSWLVWASRAFSEAADGIKFITEGSIALALLLVAIVQACVYGSQRRIMRAQWNAMEKQETAMRDQLTVMKATGGAQFDIAKITTEQAEKSAIYAQRAYVTAKIRGTGDGSHQWRLRIENSGNTPANNVCVYHSGEFRETPPWDMYAPPFRSMPEEQVLFETALMHTERLGVIAPNNSYHIVRTPKITALIPAEKKRWIGGDIKFFCWGAIVYEDIFNEKRYTWFCFFESQKYPNGYPCEHGNKAT